jgi:hypothetical protein
MMLPNRYAHEIRNNDLLSFRDGLEKVGAYPTYLISENTRAKMNLELIDSLIHLLGLPHHRPGP